MTESTRPYVLVGALLFLLLVIAGFSTLRMLDQRAQAHRAAIDLTTYEQLADQIKDLRDKDPVAATGGDPTQAEQNLAERIAQAGQATGLPNNGWFDDLVPKTPRRVGDTPYMRKDTVLYTKDLTLPQIAVLIHALTHNSTLTAETLSLRTPTRTPGDRWDADITLTYLIYDPQTTE